MPRARLALSAALAAVLSPGGAIGGAAAQTPKALVRRVGSADAKGPAEVEVDYGRGLLVAHVGAAADLRLPGPRASRPEAERRARKRGLELLRAAAAKLLLHPGVPLGKDAIERAAKTPRTLRVEYLSNGGVLLDLGFDFAALVGAPRLECQHEDEDSPAHQRLHPELVPLAIEAPVAPLALQPLLVASGAKGGKDAEVTPAFAVYRVGPPPAGAVAAKADKQGRLLFAPGAVDAAALTGRRIVVYLRRAPAP